MGCRKLDIRSQFYFVGAEEKSHSRKKTADYTQKTAYSRFSHTVISNYRDYDVDLGRWHSRDVIGEKGWYLLAAVADYTDFIDFEIWADIIFIRAKILNALAKGINSFEESNQLLDDYDELYFLQDLQNYNGTALELTEETFELYSFVGNDPINHWDIFGLRGRGGRGIGNRVDGDDPNPDTVRDEKVKGDRNKRKRRDYNKKKPKTKKDIKDKKKKRRKPKPPPGTTPVPEPVPIPEYDPVEVPEGTAEMVVVVGGIIIIILVIDLLCPPLIIRHAFGCP